VSYRLRRPWFTGQTHVTLDPVAFLRRLAALIPPPRIHLTRFHGAFAPRSKLRRAITTLVPGASTRQPETSSAIGHGSDEHQTWTQRKRMAWAKLLARVFQIDVTVCADPSCGGKTAIIAQITEPDAIEKILVHLGIDPNPPPVAAARAPPLPELDFGYPH
jgi:hypothetical protein